LSSNPAPDPPAGNFDRGSRKGGPRIESIAQREVQFVHGQGETAEKGGGCRLRGSRLAAPGHPLESASQRYVFIGIPELAQQSLNAVGTPLSRT